MQTIIGSSGEIGKRLAKSLTQFTDKIRLVSRNPVKINEGDEVFKADVLNFNEISEAVKGSDTAYLLVGIQYKAKIWEQDWHKIMDNVLNACKSQAAKLVFLDNVYMYGKVDGWMTEETPYNPCSRKGEVRAKVADRLMQEARQGNIKAMIARSADFYGPQAYNTFLHPMVFSKLKNGKKANWFGNAKVKHSFTYTPDIGKALAVLGSTEEAYNQIWHLPTDRNALTGEEIIKITAGHFNTKPNYSVYSKSMMKFAGLFNSLAKESVEMMYQYEYEYLFDSTKFENRFFKPTLYKDGLKEITDSYKKNT
jgi:nucleoside-diphosphate-sugar epimerase